MEIKDHKARTLSLSRETLANFLNERTHPEAFVGGHDPRHGQRVPTTQTGTIDTNTPYTTGGPHCNCC
jgi:hypothetical protein